MLRKKIMSVVLSAVMIVSLLPMAQVSAAYSANSGTITIGVTSQTFSLYKIFNASTADGGVNFTYSLNTTDFSGFSSSVAAYNSDPVDYVENASDAELQALTKELYTYVTTGAGNSIVPTKIDNTTNKSGALEDGYYFVLETTSLSDIDALSAGILVSVLGEDINVALKTALPTIEKKFKKILIQNGMMLQTTKLEKL